MLHRRVRFSVLHRREEGRIKAIDCSFSECEREDREGYSGHLSLADVAFAKWEKEQTVLEPEVEAKIDSLWHPDPPSCCAKSRSRSRGERKH